MPRHDAWFELHPIERSREESPDYVDWLATLPLVWMQHVYAEIPGARRYPVEVVEAAFGPYFLTGSIAYMMALALLQEPEAIGLWGVAASQEYSYQKAGILHFCQAAWDRGIDIVVPFEARHILDRPPVIPERVTW